MLSWDALLRSAGKCSPRVSESLASVQVAESIRGGMDASVLERMVKIMSYMRGSSGKPGKLKKKDKLRMLQVRAVLKSCPCCFTLTVVVLQTRKWLLRLHRLWMA